MGRILDAITARRPVLGAFVEFWIGRKKEDVATYSDGTQETISYEGGVLRDRQAVTLLATGIIGLFNLSVETAVVVEWIMNGVTLLGLIAAFFDGRKKVDAQ